MQTGPFQVGDFYVDVVVLQDDDEVAHSFGIDEEGEKRLLVLGPRRSGQGPDGQDEDRPAYSAHVTGTAPAGLGL